MASSGMALDRSLIWASFSSKEAVADFSPSFFSSFSVWLLYTPSPKSPRVRKPSSTARRTPSSVPAMASRTPSPFRVSNSRSSWGSSRSQHTRGSRANGSTPASRQRRTTSGQAAPSSQGR